MTIEKVKCTECDNLILPQTAADNAGLCAQCAQVPDWLRKKQREFEERVASGEAFALSSSEADLAKPFLEPANGETDWTLEPEIYADPKIGSVFEVIEKAHSELEGDVFLVSRAKSRLTLSFNQEFGVCEFQDSEGHNLHAYSPFNLKHQVSGELHVGQSCPCCGVGIGWYPSRLHMPRRLAFKVIESLLSKTILDNVIWIDAGDPSYTARGYG